MPCRYCTIAKVRQENVPKITTHVKATKPGHISSPTKKRIGGNSHWVLVHDYKIAAIFIFLIQTKDLLEV